MHPRRGSSAKLLVFVVLNGIVFNLLLTMAGALAATMASPVAWGHHYGILFPVLVWLYFNQGTGWVRRNLLLLGAAFVLISDDIRPLALLYSVPVLNILVSQIYLGAILVLVLLARTSATRIPETAERPP
jgi:hypothetical protein